LPFHEKKRKRGRSIVPSENFDTLDFSTITSGGEHRKSRTVIFKKTLWTNFTVFFLLKIDPLRDITIREIVY